MLIIKEKDMGITYQNYFTIVIDGEIRKFYGVKNPVKDNEVRKFLANFNIKSADVADVIVKAAVNRYKCNILDSEDAVVLPATANIKNYDVKVYFYTVDSISPWWSWRQGTDK